MISQRISYCCCKLQKTTLRYVSGFLLHQTSWTEFTKELFIFCQNGSIFSLWLGHYRPLQSRWILTQLIIRANNCLKSLAPLCMACKEYVGLVNGLLLLPFDKRTFVWSVVWQRGVCFLFSHYSSTSLNLIWHQQHQLKCAQWVKIFSEE